MHPPIIHIPGPPKTEDPPEELVQLSDTFVHPLVHHTALTCDAAGNWALLLAVPKTLDVPLREVEAQYPGIRFVYEAQPDEPLQPFVKARRKPRNR